MKKIIYIIIIVFLISFAGGCVSKNEFEELKDMARDMEDEVEDMQNDNEDLAEDVQKLTVQRDDVLEYNKEIQVKVREMTRRGADEFSVTFQEYYAQLLYLCREWGLDIFDGPMANQMDKGDYLQYVLTVSVRDETCSGIEVRLLTNKKNNRILQCGVIIYQDEVYRMDVSAYGTAYESVTHLALIALMMAENSPFNVEDIDLDNLSSIIQDGGGVYSEYGIGYGIEQTYEYEGRYFFLYN